jgi:hypothetical protein
VSLPLALALAALAASAPTRDTADETTIDAPGIARAQLIACLPARLAKWQGYRPRQPGPDPDIIDYDQRDMTPAYRLTFVETPAGTSLRVVHHVPLEPLAKAVRDCTADAVQAK